jgi:peptidoglycan/xylan/chitin deacetylase (PgdA/CDA1 family)
VPYVFSELVWRFSPAKPNIYLTFDDGPSSLVTEDILSILEEESIKATFFCVGKNVIKNPDLYKKILSSGHSIGNHSMTHPNGWKANSGFYQNDINQATELINSNLFRPPFGKLNIKSLKSLKKKFQIVMWDVVSGDFDLKLSSNKVISNVVDNTRNGSIIVMHDNDKFKALTLSSLLSIIKGLKEKGFCFKPIPFNPLM